MRILRVRIFIVSIAAAAFAAAPSYAQQSHGGDRPTSPGLRPVNDRSGRWPQGWLSFSFGVGSESFHYTDDPPGYSSSLDAPTFTLSGGARLNPVVDLGLEGYGWVNGERDGNLTIGGLMAITRIHPIPMLYLKGGAGLATTSMRDPYCGCSSSTLYGFAYSVGAGLEIPLGRRVALEPQADLFYQNYNGRSFDPYHERIVHLGLGISFNFPH
ncbi:MAG: autotransporter outer membrane beta-barrel domain-containing protein [Gemmatimonadota bacterium]